jgi:hypothetical protein
MLQGEASVTVKEARVLSRCRDADVPVIAAESMRTSDPRSALPSEGSADARLASAFCLTLGSRGEKYHVMRKWLKKESWKLKVES